MSSSTSGGGGAFRTVWKLPALFIFTFVGYGTPIKLVIFDFIVVAVERAAQLSLPVVVGNVPGEDSGSGAETNMEIVGTLFPAAEFEVPWVAADCSAAGAVTGRCFAAAELDLLGRSGPHVVGLINDGRPLGDSADA
jgi:hypothetical protein